MSESVYACRLDRAV